MLETIRTGKTQLPPRIQIYGTEGSGKSTLAANAPNPIFILTEDGVDNIECNSFPLCRSLDDVTNSLNALLTEPHDYRTVVIDTLDWLERMIWDKVCVDFGTKDKPVVSIEKVDGGFHKGYVHALTDWRKLIDMLRKLREDRKMIVILLAHAQVKEHTDPESGTFSTFSPKLHKHANALIAEWCDAILMATREYGAAKGEKGGGQRILRCEHSATCSAKNRYNLPEVLPLSWNALYEALVAGTK
jgi:hypothetical protein